MARAASYYYEPDTRSCLFCGRDTAELMPFRHEVSDLVQKTVGVPVHRACYVLRILLSLARFILITLLLALLLSLAEFWGLRALLGWTRLPVWAIAVNIAIGIPFGAWRGMESWIRLIDGINGYVRLKTFPDD